MSLAMPSSSIWFVLVGLLLFHGSSVSGQLASVHDPCVKSGECGLRQYCKSGHCACWDGHNIFLGGCEPIRTHGQECTEQIQCAMSGYPNLHCVTPMPTTTTGQRGGGAGECQCREGFERHTTINVGEDGGSSSSGQHANRCVEIPNYTFSVTRDEEERPDHIKVSLTPPGEKTNVALELPPPLKPGGAGGRLSKTAEGPTKDVGGIHAISLIGPVSIVCVVVLLFGICLCFWSLRVPSLQDDFYTVGDVEIYEGAKVDMELGRDGGGGGGGRTDFSDIIGGGGGSDNPCYVGDNMDALSHFTTQTEICDASHSEYLAQHDDDEQDRRRPSGNSTTTDAATTTSTTTAAEDHDGKTINTAAGLERRSREKELLAAGDHGVKLLFKHHAPEMSLTPSMDEADVEVAGIYKAFSTSAFVGGGGGGGGGQTHHPTLVDSSSTPPPPITQEEQRRRRKMSHVIELVETPDCTSIDTSIPQEEVAEFERGLERKREVARIMGEAEDAVAATAGAKEEQEEQEDLLTTTMLETPTEFRSLDSSVATTSVAGNEGAVSPPDTPRTKECSDFIDEVFKPVFSIS